MPHRQIEPVARRKILIEGALELRAEILAQDEEVDFVIQPERAVIDVGRTHEHPAPVDDKAFPVQQ